MGTWIKIRFEDAVIPADKVLAALGEFREEPDKTPAEELCSNFGYDTATVLDNGDVDLGDVYFDDSTSYGFADWLMELVDFCRPGAIAYIAYENEDNMFALKRVTEAETRSFEAVVTYPGLRDTNTIGKED